KVASVRKLHRTSLPMPDLSAPDLSVPRDLSTPIPDLTPPVFLVSTPLTGLGDVLVLATADFDKNGTMDLAWANTSAAGSNAVTVALNSGNGTFTVKS